MIELLEHLGIEDIRQLGVEIQARCPMHERRTGEREHRPDHWSINQISGAHHCFSCDYSGSLVRLIMDVSGIGLWDAHQLMRQFDIELGQLEDDAWEPPIQESVRATLEDFGVPPTRAMERRHLTTQACQRYGIRWDYEESAWILPIMSPTGENWGWQTKGGDYIRNHPPGVKKARTLFGIECLKSTACAVLVESPLDVPYLDRLGYPALAAFGVKVSDLQMRLIQERVDEVILALDNDKPGRTEMRRLVGEKWHHRIPMRIFNYRDIGGKDPGELSEAEIRDAIEHAIPAVFW